MFSLLNFLIPTLVFLFWVRPSLSVVVLIGTQVAMMIIFYVPFFLLFTLQRKRFKEYAHFSILFSVIGSGLFSYLTLYFSWPQFLSWCLFSGVILVSFLYKNREPINISFFNSIAPFNWVRTFFYSFLIYSLFAGTQTGPFYPPHDCDLSLAHLILPKTYSSNGGWVNAWWTRYPFIPQLMHAQYALQMTFLKTLGIRADLISSVTCLWLFTSMMQLSKVFLRDNFIYWFGIALLSLSLTRWNLSLAYMDLPSALMVMGAAAALRVSFNEPNLKQGLLLGAIVGAALAVKHMGLFYCAPLVLAWLGLRWWKIRNLDGRLAEVRFAFGASISFFVIFCITFYQNWHLTGNPLYPFLNARHPEAYRWNLNSIQEFKESIKYWVFDPTIKGAIRGFFEIFSNSNRHNEMNNFGIGLVMPFTFILILWAAKINHSIRTIASAICSVFILHYLGWYFNAGVVRYLYPTVCLMVLSSAYLVQESKSKWIAGVSLAMILFCFFHTQANWYDATPGPIPVTFSEVQQHYEKNMGGYRAFEWLDQNAPKDSIVFQYGGADRALFMPRAFLGEWFGLNDFKVFASGSPEQIKKFILDRQIDYVFEYSQQPTRKLTSLNLTPLCLEELTTVSNDSVRVLRRIYSKECQTQGVSDIRRTIPQQVTGLDFFFRKS